MTYGQAGQAQFNQVRNVGIGLALGILFLPIVFAWFVLGKGYSDRARIISLGWLGLIVTIAVMGAQGTPQAQQGQPTAVAEVAASAPSDAPETKPWLPEGYLRINKGSDPIESNVKAGYQWMAAVDLTCTGAERCTGIYIIPSKACDRLFVTLSVEDSAGNNVGYTNSMTAGVAKNQQAKMVFSSYDAGAYSFRVKEVKCSNS